MRLKTEEKLARGTITPVADTEYVGHPVVGYIVENEDGFWVFMNDHMAVRRDSFTEAMGYIEAVRKRS